MIELTLTFERKTINTFRFDKDAVLIGRDPTCDVRIDNVGVSRHHARIEKHGGVYVLMDLASGNGIFVHGKRINQYNLNDGDEVNIWNYSLFFKVLQPEVSKGEEEKSRLRKEDLDMTIAIDQRQLDLKQKERSSRLAAYLSFQDTRGNERTYSLMKSAVFFGKDKNCEFKMPGWFILPRHAMILRDESGFRFINFSHRRVGLINNEKVDAHRLKHGDVIQIISQTFKFFVGMPSSH